MNKKNRNSFATPEYTVFKYLNIKIVEHTWTDKVLEPVIDRLKKVLQEEEQIKSVVNDQQKEKEWIKCLKKCFTLLRNLMEEEVKSTGFMLKLLSESGINAWGVNTKLSFTTSAKNDDLNGYWKNDSKYF